MQVVRVGRDQGTNRFALLEATCIDLGRRHGDFEVDCLAPQQCGQQASVRERYDEHRLYVAAFPFTCPARIYFPGELLLNRIYSSGASTKLDRRSRQGHHFFIAVSHSWSLHGQLPSACASHSPHAECGERVSDVGGRILKYRNGLQRQVFSGP